MSDSTVEEAIGKAYKVAQLPRHTTPTGGRPLRSQRHLVETVDSLCQATDFDCEMIQQLAPCSVTEVWRRRVTANPQLPPPDFIDHQSREPAGLHHPLPKRVDHALLTTKVRPWWMDYTAVETEILKIIRVDIQVRCSITPHHTLQLHREFEEARKGW